MKKKKYLVALSSILLIQSLSISCVLMMPEHPAVYKHQIMQKQVNNKKEIRNINLNDLNKLNINHFPF